VKEKQVIILEKGLGMDKKVAAVVVIVVGLLMKGVLEVVEVLVFDKDYCGFEAPRVSVVVFLIERGNGMQLLYPY
jgi:hypothetical protein